MPTSASFSTLLEHAQCPHDPIPAGKGWEEGFLISILYYTVTILSGVRGWGGGRKLVCNSYVL